MDSISGLARCRCLPKALRLRSALFKRKISKELEGVKYIYIYIYDTTQEEK